MMKKLLILMLVLGLTSAASAVVSLGGASTVDIGLTAVVTVDSSDSIMWWGYVASTDGGVTSVVQTAAAGSDYEIIPSPYGFVGYWQIEAADLSDPFDSVLAGTQFNATVTSNGSDLGTTYVVSILDTDWYTVLATRNVLVIPEPMTIVLLGLGGLFLRRRK